MDQGNAALYAAIIGFAAAIIGAAVGGWASWRAARHSAEAAVAAAVEQVNGQAANEHAHWVRQERLRAYVAVNRAFTAYARPFGEFCDAIEDGAETSEPLSELSRSAHELLIAAHGIQLLGPASITTAAERVADAVGALVAKCSEWADRASQGGGRGMPHQVETIRNDCGAAMATFNICCHGCLMDANPTP